jgi:hypothetical protein
MEKSNKKAKKDPELSEDDLLYLQKNITRSEQMMVLMDKFPPNMNYFMSDNLIKLYDYLYDSFRKREKRKSPGEKEEEKELIDLFAQFGVQERFAVIYLTADRVFRDYSNNLIELYIEKKNINKKKFRTITRKERTYHGMHPTSTICYLSRDAPEKYTYKISIHRDIYNALTEGLNLLRLKLFDYGILRSDIFIHFICIYRAKGFITSIMPGINAVIFTKKYRWMFQIMLKYFPEILSEILRKMSPIMKYDDQICPQSLHDLYNSEYFNPFEEEILPYEFGNLEKIIYLVTIREELYEYIINDVLDIIMIYFGND